jgi:hypothetical protein
LQFGGDVVHGVANGTESFEVFVVDVKSRDVTRQ